MGGMAHKQQFTAPHIRLETWVSCQPWLADHGSIDRQGIVEKYRLTFGIALMSENTHEDSPPLCPYCGSENDCEHLLLVVDTTFRTAVGGKLFEAFNDRWAALFGADQAAPDFDEAAEFDALLEIVDGVADASNVFEIEVGPGMSSLYSTFYVSTGARLKLANKKFCAWK